VESNGRATAAPRTAGSRAVSAAGWCGGGCLDMSGKPSTSHQVHGCDDDDGPSRSGLHAAARSCANTTEDSRRVWSPYGLCTSPPSRVRSAGSQSAAVRDRFIPCRAPLDSKLSNYLLEAPSEEQDFESTPSKQVCCLSLRRGQQVPSSFPVDPPNDVTPRGAGLHQHSAREHAASV